MKKDYLTTRSGHHLTPLEPDLDDIVLQDISHSLSMLCRATGHVKHFYSVGQHSVNCCLEAKARGYTKRVQLACLLHDGSEAYLSDITRPVKKHLDRYREIEENLQNCIYKKYLGSILSKEEENKVSDVDDAILYCEFEQLMSEKINTERPVIKSTPQLGLLSFEEVESTFEELFRRLNT